VPLKFEMGETFQLNWCEEGLVVGVSTTACRCRT
jgi:hypothetical protein